MSTVTTPTGALLEPHASPVDLSDTAHWGAVALEMAGLPPLDPAVVARQRLAARYGGQVPAWRDALESAIATDPRGAAGVAVRLDVSRPYVSRVMNFSMWPAPAPFVQRVHAVLMQVSCPHLGTAISPAACRTYARRNFADISAFEVDHWRACQRCTAKAPEAPAHPYGPGRETRHED